MSDDEYLTGILSSKRDTTTIMQTVFYITKNSAWLHAHMCEMNACKKGTPNLTSKMFADWVVVAKVHESSARRRLLQLSRVHHQRVYILMVMSGKMLLHIEMYSSVK